MAIIQGKERRIHWLKSSGRKNARMYCGKIFAWADLKRTTRHIAKRLEDIDCPECLDILIPMLNSRYRSAIARRESNV